MSILEDISAEKKDVVQHRYESAQKSLDFGIVGKLTKIFKAIFFLWNLAKNIFIIYLMIKFLF